MQGRIRAEVRVQFRTSFSLKSNVVPFHAMKAYIGAEVWLHSSLRGNWLPSHSDRFTPWVKSQYSLNRRLGGPQKWSGCFG
jgi:hypothetical protein